MFVIGEGRLVNLAAGDGHPVEIMDMSFAVQALAQLYLLKNHENLSSKVYDFPHEMDEEIAKLMLKSIGVEIDEMTQEQKEYMKSWK